MKKKPTKVKKHRAFLDEDECFMVECPVTGAIEHQYEKGDKAHCKGCGAFLFTFKCE